MNRVIEFEQTRWRADATGNPMFLPVDNLWAAEMNVAPQVLIEVTVAALRQEGCVESFSDTLFFARPRPANDCWRRNRARLIGYNAEEIDQIQQILFPEESE